MSYNGRQSSTLPRYQAPYADPHTGAVLTLGWNSETQDWDPTGMPFNIRTTAAEGRRKPKRTRTAFNDPQSLELDREYKRAKYVDRPRRMKLAAKLHLNERTVKIWFQNRRMKEKRDKAEGIEVSCSENSLTFNVPDNNYSPISISDDEQQKATNAPFYNAPANSIHNGFDCNMHYAQYVNTYNNIPYSAVAHNGQHASTSTYTNAQSVQYGHAQYMSQYQVCSAAHNNYYQSNQYSVAPYANGYAEPTQPVHCGTELAVHNSDAYAPVQPLKEISLLPIQPPASEVIPQDVANDTETADWLQSLYFDPDFQ